MAANDMGAADGLGAEPNADLLNDSELLDVLKALGQALRDGLTLLEILSRVLERRSEMRQRQEN